MARAGVARMRADGRRGDAGAAMARAGVARARPGGRRDDAGAAMVTADAARATAEATTAATMAMAGCVSRGGGSCFEVWGG